MGVKLGRSVVRSRTAVTAVLIGLGGLVLPTAVAQAQAALPWCVGPAKPCNPDDPKDPNCYQPPPPDCRCEPKECGKCQKSPNFVGSGVYSISETDLQIPTPGFPLEVSRSYTSTNLVDGPLGYGWSTNLVPRAHLAVYLFAAPDVVQSEAVIVMPDGARYRFTRNGDGSFTPPLGRYDKLVANADGTFDMTLQRSRSVFHFNADGTIGWMADDFNNRLEYTYDGNGRLSRVADAAGSGRYLDVYWGADGRLSTVADHTGRTIGYVYDSDGNLIEVSDPLSRRTHYFYTTGKYHALLSQVRDNWDRVVTTITYDLQDRVKNYTEAEETWTYIYNYGNDANRSAKSDSMGNTWIFTHANAGLVTAVQDPSGAVRATTYDANGAILQVVDETGVRTLYTRDPQGRILSGTRDDQGPTAVRYDYTYDPDFVGQVTASTPRNPATGQVDTTWQAWRYDYYPVDSNAPGALWHVWRVDRENESPQLVATYTYDSRGRLVSEVDAVGSEVTYQYGPQGDLEQIIFPPNNDSGTRPAIHLDRDSVGRIVSYVDPSGNSTALGYDALNRLVSVVAPQPAPGFPDEFETTFTHDAFDSATGLAFLVRRDSNGRESRKGFDQFDRLVRDIDVLGNQTLFNHTKGLVSSITDANGYSTLYEYNSLGWLATNIHPDGTSEVFQYRPDGMLATRTDRKGQTTTFQYDRLKRLSLQSYADSTSVQYVYEGQNLVQVVNTSATPAESHSFSYDSLFRLEEETQGLRATMKYSYTEADQLESFEVLGGSIAIYSYYPDGSLNTIGWNEIEGEFKFDYDLRGLYQSVQFPNAQSREYRFDGQGRLTEIANTHPALGILASYSYAYDVDHENGLLARKGLRTSMTQTVPGQSIFGAVTKYSYDDRDQLVASQYPERQSQDAETHSWTYDAVGNRTSSAVDGVLTTYTYRRVAGNNENWQRLLSAGPTSFSYDLNGNLTGLAGTESFSFAWDPADRLRTISGSASVSYSYDYLGRRVGRAEGGSSTSFLYRGLDLIGEVGTQTSNYLFGPGIDEPLAMSRNGSVQYLGVDGLGSVVTQNDPSGAVLSTQRYSVWGELETPVNGLESAFGFTAREYGDASLWAYRARYYDPKRGRFASEDPSGFADGINKYAYVRSNPANWRDPLGLEVFIPSRTPPIIRPGPWRLPPGRGPGPRLCRAQRPTPSREWEPPLGRPLPPWPPEVPPGPLWKKFLHAAARILENITDPQAPNLPAVPIPVPHGPANPVPPVPLAPPGPPDCECPQDPFAPVWA